ARDKLETWLPSRNQLSDRLIWDLQPLVQKWGTRASEGTPVEAVEFGDVVMLTVPPKAMPDMARGASTSIAKSTVVQITILLSASNACVAWVLAWPSM